MKVLRNLIGPVLLAIFLLLAVWGLLVAHMRLPAGTNVAGLPSGQHVWVLRTAYGLRLPCETLWGYHRLGYKMPQEGDAVLFNLPSANGVNSSGQKVAGVCRSVSGDTVWTDPVRRIILPGRTSPDATPIAVPASGMSVRVTPYNARLYASIMRCHEKKDAKVDSQNRLFINGKEKKAVSFGHDYYWIETLPDSFLLVPHEALIGKILPMRNKTGKD